MSGSAARVLDQLEEVRGALPPPANRPGRQSRQGSLLHVGEHRDGSPHFRFRLRLADGSKSARLDVPGGKDLVAARAFVTEMQALEDAHHGLLKQKETAVRTRSAPRSGELSTWETWDQWFARYLPSKDCSEGYRRITASVAAKWVSPVIGLKAVRVLTRDDLEDVRDRLDRAIDAKEIRHATARNAWGTLTAALKAAYAARDRSLRVLAAPIHVGILPPKRGESRQRPWLYPNEWDAFVQCESVPLQFRQVCALALYTGLRPGELAALTWADVDLAARTVSVSKAIDPHDGSVKAPKTARGQRVIPLHDALVTMLDGCRGTHDQRVIDALGGLSSDMAVRFREYLKAAGVMRPRLLADNETEESVDFRSLRDTHATWLSLVGLSAQVIQRRMGHAHGGTTDRYVKVAETVGVERVGQPFASLARGV